MNTTATESNLSAVIDDNATRPYWQAAAEGRLVIKRCQACAQVHFYPRPLCPYCLGDTEWIEARGTGNVYSLSTVYQTHGQFTIAYVELDEGVTLLTNLVGSVAGASIGTRVRVTMQRAANGYAVPMFTTNVNEDI